jgi:hypothetical protein
MEVILKANPWKEGRKAGTSFCFCFSETTNMETKSNLDESRSGYLKTTRALMLL